MDDLSGTMEEIRHHPPVGPVGAVGAVGAVGSAVGAVGAAGAVGATGPIMCSGMAVIAKNLTTPNRRGKARMTLHAHALMSEALPLDEAARLEMQALPNKTPVSVLQELMSRRGTTPKYELVQIEGAVHEPTFRYRVTVADVVGSYKLVHYRE